MIKRLRGVAFQYSEDQALPEQSEPGSDESAEVEPEDAEESEDVGRTWDDEFSSDDDVDPMEREIARRARLEGEDSDAEEPGPKRNKVSAKVVGAAAKPSAAAADSDGGDSDDLAVPGYRATDAELAGLNLDLLEGISEDEGDGSEGEGAHGGKARASPFQCDLCPHKKLVSEADVVAHLKTKSHLKAARRQDRSAEQLTKVKAKNRAKAERRRQRRQASKASEPSSQINSAPSADSSNLLPQTPKAVKQSKTTSQAQTPGTLVKQGKLATTAPDSPPSPEQKAKKKRKSKKTPATPAAMETSQKPRDNKPRPVTTDSTPLMKAASLTPGSTDGPGPEQVKKQPKHPQPVAVNAEATSQGKTKKKQLKQTAEQSAGEAALTTPQVTTFSQANPTALAPAGKKVKTRKNK